VPDDSDGAVRPRLAPLTNRSSPLPPALYLEEVRNPNAWWPLHVVTTPLALEAISEGQDDDTLAFGGSVPEVTSGGYVLGVHQWTRGCFFAPAVLSPGPPWLPAAAHGGAHAHAALVWMRAHLLVAIDSVATFPKHLMARHLL
jgi:hypothetical protein